jgi:hypothetical protein
MNWPASIGWILFICVPGLIWLLGALANRGHEPSAKALGFVVGSDNRLSLSRLQAFLWTLIIFGSYFAAIAVHAKIEATATWVQIPSPLLAIAGIALGSGVFSSLIAAVNGDHTIAHITSLGPIPETDPNFGPGGEFEKVQKPPNPNYLLITGVDLGDGGKVRAKLKGKGTTTLPYLMWKKDGTEILLDVPNGLAYQDLTLETPNGKLSYELSGQTPYLVLGREKINYEFGDLFRDDKNPENLSLMKFQMFGWTVIALFIYVYLFLANLDPNTATLPNVDSSIAMLTGVSQAGYLAGKGVSNVSPNEH